jgi:phosphomannomutase
LVGIALFLTHLAKTGSKCSELRGKYPDYFITKTKVEINEDLNFKEVVLAIQDKYKSLEITTIDGVRVDFDQEWFHIRKSNTEHIVRIIA